jgi:hypothetical protein
MAKNVVSFVWGFAEASFIFLIIMFPFSGESWTPLLWFPLLVSTIGMVVTIAPWVEKHWSDK